MAKKKTASQKGRMSRNKGKAEKWYSLTGEFFGYYEVSDLGRVRNVAISNYRKYGRVLKQSLDGNGKGYWQVGLSKNGKGVSKKVHILMMESIKGIRPKGYHIDHINNDNRDNRIENLEYVTPKENARRSAINGNHIGPRKPREKGLKINYSIAETIRFMVEMGTTRKALAEMYGLHVMTIGEIVREDIWPKRKQLVKKEG